MIKSAEIEVTGESFLSNIAAKGLTCALLQSSPGYQDLYTVTGEFPILLSFLLECTGGDRHASLGMIVD